MISPPGSVCFPSSDWLIATAWRGWKPNSEMPHFGYFEELRVCTSVPSVCAFSFIECGVPDTAGLSVGHSYLIQHILRKKQLIEGCQDINHSLHFCTEKGLKWCWLCYLSLLLQRPRARVMCSSSQMTILTAESEITTSFWWNSSHPGECETILAFNYVFSMRFRNLVHSSLL